VDERGGVRAERRREDHGNGQAPDRAEAHNTPPWVQGSRRSGNGDAIDVDL
jgi:hypothetical protein